METGRIVSIVPGDKSVNGPTRCNGTRVLVGGVEVAGVRRLELIAEPGEVWKAVIYCDVYVEPGILARAQFKEHK